MIRSGICTDIPPSTLWMFGIWIDVNVWIRWHITKANKIDNLSESLSKLDSSLGFHYPIWSKTTFGVQVISYFGLDGHNFDTTLKNFLTRVSSANSLRWIKAIADRKLFTDPYDIFSSYSYFVFCIFSYTF